MAKWVCQVVSFVSWSGDKWPHETAESMEGWSYAERVVICLTRDLPRGCFFTVDRNFMTPKLAAWMKMERGQYVTGTMKKNTKYIDKSLLFKKSAKTPRGYYNWSTDERTGVSQVCWMDREAVPMCSGAFGARCVGAKRLTTKLEEGEVVPQNRRRQVRTKKMKCPHMGVIYNGTMWPVDCVDYMALDSGTSWERGCRSKVWWAIGMWGLLDRAACNCFIIFRRRQQPSSYRHGEFQKRLTTQLFHIARKQRPIGDLSAASIIEKYDYSVLWPNTVPSFRDPAPDERVDTSEEEDQTSFPGHKVGQLKNKTTCFLCRKEGRYKEGSERKGREGKVYRLYAKTSKGCKSCNVPLCRIYNCWKDYHSGPFAGKQEYIPESAWR